MTRGRTTSFTKKTGDKICEHIAAGKSLIKWCNANKVGYSTVMEWLKQFPEFADQYTRAREAQADFHADEIIEIADNPKLMADQKRVQIDARKWKAGKMKPKVYGEKLQQEVTGKDGAPLITGLTVTFVKPDAG